MPSSSESIFKTHLNYVRCIAGQYAGLSLTTPLTPTSALSTTNINRFKKLADLTSKSIEIELKAGSIDHEYAQIIVGWIPVKCYYRIYYLESIMVYLLNGNSIGFGRGGHKGVRRALSILINNNQLAFSNVNISTQSTIAMIRTHKIASGANLSPTYYLTDDCVHSVRKKISEYQEQDWKAGRKIKTYSTAASRSSRDNYYATSTLNLTDFFYWMRIKVNYKDLDFLDFPSAGSPDDAYEYVKNYIDGHQAYSSALEAIILQLKAMRNM
ncbi:MAG: hypothetical protein U5K77_02485 [Candidatus Saccharibacteria bacterium]|nr:hypothetical protein [Candidatus Saccharibacteria bacterium]